MFNLRLFQRTPVELKVGTNAPDFQAFTQLGLPFQLADHLGNKIIVLYFYPKDHTYFCIHESKMFRDHYEEFKKRGAEVVGVSSDSIESHLGFARKYGLPFPLLSDQNNHIRKLYRVPPTLGLIPGRTTYVIDKKGIIRHVFTSQFQYDSHVKLSLDIVQKLNDVATPIAR